MSVPFKDKVIWITGASSGIGEALAEQFARMGAHLILSSRNREKLDSVAGELRKDGASRLEVLPLDMSDKDSLDSALDYVKNHYDRIDILINNAGISQRSFILETPVNIDRRIFEVNFFGTVTLTKGVLPLMLDAGGGHIVVMSSVVGKFGIPLRSSYSASKHALHGFFETLRSELGRKNIRVTIICPGRITTNISVNAITRDGSNYNRMDEGQARGVPADVFARKVIRAIRRNKKEAVMGGREIIMVYIRRYLPWLYYLMSSRVKPT